MSINIKEMDFGWVKIFLLAASPVIMLLIVTAIFQSVIKNGDTGNILEEQMEIKCQKDCEDASMNYFRYYRKGIINDRSCICSVNIEPSTNQEGVPRTDRPLIDYELNQIW